MLHPEGTRQRSISAPQKQRSFAPAAASDQDDNLLGKLFFYEPLDKVLGGAFQPNSWSQGFSRFQSHKPPKGSTPSCCEL
jgi:hypothetical protein